MTKRIRFTLNDLEYREIRRIARSRGISLSAWVREALGLARRSHAARELRRKFRAIRVAVRHEFPIGDMDRMLTEIETGRAESRENP